MNAEQVRAVCVPLEAVTGWRWPSFTPKEIACRGTGLVPDPKECPQFAAAMDRLQALRDHFGVPLIVTSAYRTPGHNRSIKGAARRSRHMLGMAFDVSIVNADPHRVEAKALDLGFNGIGRYPKSRFIHIDMRDKPADWGKDWPETAGRFDPTTERPDGVEGMLKRLVRRFVAWVMGGGSVVAVVEHFTNAINRTMASLFGFLSSQTLPSWPVLMLFTGAVALVGIAVFLYRNRKEPTNENPYRTPQSGTVSGGRKSRIGDDHPRSDSGRGGGQHSHPPRFGGIDKALLGRLQRGA